MDIINFPIYGKVSKKELINILKSVYQKGYSQEKTFQPEIVEGLLNEIDRLEIENQNYKTLLNSSQLEIAKLYKEICSMKNIIKEELKNFNKIIERMSNFF